MSATHHALFYLMLMFGVLGVLFIWGHISRCADSLKRIADALEGKDPDENDDDLEQ